MKNINKLIFSMFLLLFLALLACTVKFASPVYATSYGASWLTGWNYRQQYNVSQTTGAASNYQLNVTVSNSTGTSSGYICYANGHILMANYTDIRVTANDGSTLLSICNETVNTGASGNATVWFKDTDNLSNAQSTVYVYYGNSAASTVWNGWNTFLLYDNFQGSTLNATNWTNYTTIKAETRYFRSDVVLSQTQSSTQADNPDNGGHSGGGYLGLEVYVGGVLKSGATCVAVSAKGTGSASYKAGSWSCPGYSDVGQVKISVYSCTSAGTPYDDVGDFTTSETNLQLQAGTWTLQYGIKWTSATTTTDFYYGKSSAYYNSKISGFLTQFDSSLGVVLSNGVATINSSTIAADGWSGIQSATSWSGQVAARTFMQLGTPSTNTGDEVGFAIGGGNSVLSVLYYDTSNVVRTDQAGTINSANSNLDGNWSTYDLEWNASRADYIRNGTALTGSPITTDVPNVALPFLFNVAGTSGPLSVKWVFVRNYVYPEPASGTWGAERYKTFSVTVTSSPATGAGYITVDGAAQSTPYTATWNVGDSHTIAANSPANLVTNQSQYLYVSWNDSGAQSHSVTPETGTTYTVTFQLQYCLRVDGGNGPTGGGWYNSGVSAMASNNWVWSTVAGQSRTALTNWQLDGSNQNPARSDTGNLTTSSITMSTYHLAMFTATTQYYLTVTGGNSITYGTASQTSDNWYDTGSSSTVISDWVWNTVAGQSRSAITNYAVDGSNQNPSRSNAGSLTTSSVSFTTYHMVAFASVTQYYLTVTGGDSVTYGTASPTSDNWYDSGGATTVISSWVWNLVSGQNRTAISNWQLDTVNQNPARQNTGTLTTSSVSMTTYHAVTFVSVTQYYLSVSGGNSISYGTVSPTSDNWYDISTSTTISSSWVWNIVASQSRTSLSNYALDGTNQNPSRSNTGTLTTASISFASSNHTIAFTSITQYFNTLSTGVAGSAVGQSGSQTSDNWYDTGSASQVSATTPYLNGTTNRFFFVNWTWTLGGIVQSNSSSTPYSITMSNYAAATANWNNDVIVLFGSSIGSAHVNVDASVYINLTYKWQSDNTAIPDGFIVQVNGTSRTLSGSWTNFTYSESTVKTDAFQISQAQGGNYFVNSVSPTETWDALSTVNLQPPVYLGNGTYLYQAQLYYAFAGTLVNGGVMGATCPGHSYTTTTNSTGWGIFILDQANGTNGHFTLYGVSEPVYGLTVDASNQTFSLLKWTLTPEDTSLNVLANVQSINITAGASSVWNGTASYILVPSDTFTVKVYWIQNILVNTTVNVAVNDNITSTFQSTCYPFTLSGTMYWTASNATITSFTFSSSTFTVDFSSPIGAYALVSSCTTIPSYILNCTYDLANDFTPFGILVLPHFGNATLTVSYLGLGGFHVQSTDQFLTSVSIVSGELRLKPSGTVGAIGTLKVYCASYGDPATTGGFTSGVYGGQVYQGTYVLNGQTLTLSWASSPFSGSSEGGFEGSTQSFTVGIVFSFPQQASANQVVSGTLNVTWTSYAEIYVWQVLCNQPYAGWVVDVGRLPLALLSNQSAGSASLPVSLTVPSSVASGSYQVPCNVTFQTPTGDAKTVGSTVSLTIGAAQVTLIGAGAVPFVEMAAFLGLFSLFIMTLFVRKSRSNKGQF